MTRTTDPIRSILSRIKTGTPLTVTNKERLAIWIGELIELERADERERCCAIIFGNCQSDNVAQRTVDAIRTSTNEKRKR